MMKVLVCSDYETLTNRPGGDAECQFFTKENIEKIESLFDEVVWNKTGRQFTTEELIENIKDCDAVITCWGSNTFDEEILNNAPKLKIIAHLAGSVAWLVTPEVFDRGIIVCGANDREFSESVAEAALLYSIAKLRNLDRSVLRLKKDKADGWHDPKIHAKGIFDRNVGIVGFGAIGKYFAGLLQPFHCNIKVFSIYPIEKEILDKYKMEQVGLEELFKTCDVVSLHTAWNKQTEKMVSRELIRSMKDGAVFVNTARGRIVDEEALIDELKTGRISAALDVYWNEPLSSDSPLYEMDNVMVMDHRGGPTHDRYPHIASNMIDDVYNYLKNGVVPDSKIEKERALSMTLS